MSNMLFCCSILFRLKLPLLILFNKLDLNQEKVQEDWMKDYDKFIQSLKEYDSLYLTSFSRSLSLALDDFYQKLAFRFVSCLTMEGMSGLGGTLEQLKEEYFEFYHQSLVDKFKEMTLEGKSKVEGEKKKFKEDPPTVP